MKTIVLITVSTILSFIILITPTIFISDLEKAIGIGASILSGLVGAGTIVLGYIISKDLGIGKKIIDKKADTVIAFLEELKVIRIQAGYYSGNELSGIAYMMLKKGAKFDEFYGKSAANKSNISELFVSFLPENYYSRLEKLFMLKSSIYMPADLVVQFEFLTPSMMTGVSEDEKYKNKVRIIVNDKFDLDEKEEKIWMKMTDKDITFKEYYSSLQETIVICEAWLQKNSKVKLNLNL